jgi:DNA-binding response OmpR family regulator
MKKILVVDDDRDIVELLVSRLQANNYEVMVGYDGLRAVDQAINHQPDLIILDMRMPAGSGESVYQRLKNSTRTAVIPVIFITAFTGEDLKEKVLKMGARDFISKPFDAQVLLDKIKKILGE